MVAKRGQVLASFHVVHFRRPKIVPPRKLVGKVEGLRYWGALNVGGNFHELRESAHPRWALYQKLKPDFFRWAFFGVWDDEAALAHFLGQSSIGRAWTERSREALHLWLKPIRLRGRWVAIQELAGAEESHLPKSPVAFITPLDLSLGSTLRMWLSAAPSILPYVPTAKDVVLALPLVDRPYTQPMTFTIWKSIDQALAFAYRDGHHSRAVEHVDQKRADFSERCFSAAAFYPWRAVGTWNGQDPLAQALTSP
jgi:hypothetical protein